MRRRRRRQGIATALRDGLYGALLGLLAGWYPPMTAASWTMSIEFGGLLLLIAVFVAMRPFRRRDGSNSLLVAVFLTIGILGGFLYLSLFARSAPPIRLSKLRDRRDGRPAWAGLDHGGPVGPGAVFLGTLPYAETRGPVDGLAGGARAGHDRGPDGRRRTAPFRGIADENFWQTRSAPC